MSLKNSPGFYVPSILPKTEAARPAVTVVSGFLGAGKTTLLRHLVTAPHGLRVALIVNDLNALNLDAELLSASAPGAKIAAADAVVALSNGCICCSVRDALGDAVVQLAASGDYDHILIESSGVASPRPIADLFFMANAVGPRLEQVADLHALVTVVDAASWLTAWQEQQALGRVHPTDAAPLNADGHQPVFSLMVEQAECADVILLNKTDLLTPGELGAAASLLRGLNPRAEIVETEWSALPAGVWPGPVRFERKTTFAAAAWMQGLNQATTLAGDALRSRVRSTQTRPACRRLDPAPVRAPGKSPPGALPDYAARYGLGSFLFQRWQPVAEGRLRAFFEAGQPGLLRAKGFFWSEEEPDRLGFLSVAGRIVELHYLRPWAATMIEAGVVPRAALPATLQAVWRDPHGDRRLELVLIGVRLDVPALGDALDALLATD